MVVERSPWSRIEPIVRRQHGCITWDQLLEADWTVAQVRTALGRGSLRRTHRGVYVAGDPALISLSAESAAILSLPPRCAVLSHRSAAAMWSMAKPDPSTVTVTLVGHRARGRDGVKLHHATLHPRDIRRRHNLPVTAPARTLIDFASEASAQELEAAIGDGMAQNYLSEPELEAALDRAPANHPGAALVRALIADQGLTDTRSGGERTLRRLIAAAGLPEPLINHRLHGMTVDFYWPDVRVVVELDSVSAHGNRLAFERDRRRDQVLAAAGIVVIRVTGRQLVREPLTVIAAIAQALAARAAA